MNQLYCTIRNNIFMIINKQIIQSWSLTLWSTHGCLQPTKSHLEDSGRDVEMWSWFGACDACFVSAVQHRTEVGLQGVVTRCSLFFSVCYLEHGGGDVTHRWTVSPNQRFHKTRGCPYCMNKKPCKCNSLQTRCPDIAAEWDYSINVKTPDDYLAYQDMLVGGQAHSA